MVVGGQQNTWNTILEALRNNVSVVLIKGSGGVADEVVTQIQQYLQFACISMNLIL